MQEFIFAIKSAQNDTTQPNDITKLLFKCQTEINAQLFNKIMPDELENCFKEVWRFLLYAASHTSSSVRLSAYRATGAFLLKLTPYYNSIISKTFSDISMGATIDIKSSAIIASSFAFISSRIALPYLDEFLNSTPVFHHFTISDPIFSEHLSSIISNLGELGNEWFSTLLHSFLSIYETSTDRYLMKSITSVINHDPQYLMNEYLHYIDEQASHKKHLALVSFIVTSIHIDTDSFDFFNLAKAAMDILAHFGNYTATDVDSSFQILSIKSPSFYLQVDSAGMESITLTLNKKKPDQSDDLIDFGFDDSPKTSGNNEHMTIILKASNFKRPTIYLLDLPLNFSDPTNDDGALTMAAKFKSLAARIKTFPEKTPIVLNIFLKFYNKVFDSTVSAVLQGIAECVPVLLKFGDFNTIVSLLESAIFTPPVNWFHAADILSIVENLPIDSIEKLFGSNGLNRIVNLLIELSLLQNDQVYNRANKVFRSYLNHSNFNMITSTIASKIDVFDDYNLSHLLPLLTDILGDILKEFPDEKLLHLQYLVFQLIELTNYSTNLVVLTSLFKFIGNFNIDFMQSKVVSPIFSMALSIIASSIQCVSGFSDWENVLPAEQLASTYEMIQNDILSKNIDVNSEHSLSYSNFLAPCVAALKFVYGIPQKLVKKSFILILYRKLRNIFPLDAAKFVKKFWPEFTDDEKVEIILKMYKSLRFVQRYDVAAITTYLFIQIYKKETENKLKDVKEELLLIAKFAKDHPQSVSKEQLTIFKALLQFCSIDKQSVNNQTNMIQTNPFNSSDQAIPNQTSPFNQLNKSLSNNPSAPVNPYNIDSDSYTNSNNNPNIKSSNDLFDLFDNFNSSNNLNSPKQNNQIPTNPFNSLNNTTNVLIDITNCSPNNSNEFESDILKFYPDIYTIIFNKPRPNSFNKSISQDIDSNLTNVVYNHRKLPTNLSFQLNTSDPIVKSQIKKLLRQFSPDELNSALKHYIQIADIPGIKLVLQYCFTKNIYIDLTHLNFPDKALPIVIRFLRSSRSPDLEKFIIPYLNDESLPRDTYIAVTLACSTKYLQRIRESEKLTKIQLKNFASVIPYAQFQPNELSVSVIHCLEIAKSVKKMQFSLFVVLNALLTLRQIPNDLISAIFSFFDKNLTELGSCPYFTYYTSTQILNLITIKSPNQVNVLNYANNFLTLISPSSPEIYLLYVIIETLSRNNKTYSKEVPKECEHLLNTYYPSMFITGVMLFTHALKTLQSDRLQSLMKHSLNIIIRKLRKHFKLFPVPESTAISLVNILNNTALKKHHQQFVSGLSEIIPACDDASFSSYYIVLAHALSATEDNPKLAEESQIFKKRMSELIQNPPCTAFLLKTYIKMIIARAEKIQPKAKQEYYVMEEMSSFMNNLQNQCDFYDLSSVICEWCSALNRFNGFTQLLPVMTDQIFRNSPRFFPVFVGVSLFLKKYKMACPNQELISRVNASFVGCGKQMTLIHRAHGVAMQLLTDPSKMSLALDLASFEDDCPESDSILQNCQM
ncbi:hypothetical protein TRFO_15175 [Tritrichomonas foetus]|uniref:Uncharacterized protein n=1 Tax=Tritrichomonas foetus TaxID=1144522 RepID=A0A1J4KSY2_9EUKA|nr:hypothetical protein TRFO_15175 [Tritrichomonas foetus]|eukprot:OHT14401.1 hypothetical protein TRFO_15175 [Tritrichomonas foetus]